MGHRASCYMRGSWLVLMSIEFQSSAGHMASCYVSVPVLLLPDVSFQSPAGHMASCYIVGTKVLDSGTQFQSPAGHMAGCYPARAGINTNKYCLRHPFSACVKSLSRSAPRANRVRALAPLTVRAQMISGLRKSVCTFTPK